MRISDWSSDVCSSDLDQVRKAGDTVGGVVSCVIDGCPAGLGEPVFDKLHADLAKAMLSINAAHGFEYGSGFDGTYLRGSQHNDLFEQTDGRIRTQKIGRASCRERVCQYV